MDNAAVVAFCNLVGGQDELVFDGRSAIFSERGAVLVRGKQFEEDFIVADVDTDAVLRWRLREPRHRKVEPRSLPVVDLPAIQQPAAPDRPRLSPHLNEPLPHLAEIYSALTLGLRDYAHKNGFQEGRFGGIRWGRFEPGCLHRSRRIGTGERDGTLDAFALHR